MASPKPSLHALYKDHAKELTSFASQRVGHEDSRDVVHDAYVRLATYGEPESLQNPRAYLYRVTANVANDYGRRSIRRSEVADPGSDPCEAISPTPGPDQQLEHRRTLERCLAALEKLPDIYRHVFLLHRVDGIPQAEISAALGIPKRTVERYIAKALAHCMLSQGD